ncbi:MAG: phosphoribosylglycinamide formyltransferase [Ruminococcaceae bacterium]|nr:phosphoribosylglycinamide formyltransferase [Oscillospiraceae bacterium]
MTVENKIKIGVFVSGGGTNLQALIDAQSCGKLKSGEIVLVVSSKPDVYALERAANAGIPAAVANRKLLRDQNTFEATLTELLDESQVEVIVLAGFLSILSESFVKKYEKRIINVHPSLIPSFCGDGFYGLRVHEAALARGVKVTGATVHFVNEITDGGEIILQKAVSVKNGDTPETLQRRVMEEAEWKILPEAVELVCQKIAKNKIKGE